MNKRLKITIAILMTVLLSVAGIAITAYAAAYASDSAAISGGAVCRIGAAGTGTYYNSLSEAVSAANDNDVITVIADTTVTSAITVNKNIKLTSNDVKKIECSVTKAFTITNGMLTIGGNLDISNTQTIMIFPNGGDFTLEDNAYLHATGVKYIIDSGAANDIYIKGGKIEHTCGEDNAAAIWIGNKGDTFTMTGGEIIQNRNKASALKIATDKDAKVNISGGKLTSTCWTIHMYGGNQTADTGFNLNISGGEITATGGDYALHNYNNSTYGNINITGGTIKAKGYAMFTHTGYDISISGGTIESLGSLAIAYKGGSKGANIEISGDAHIKTPANVLEVNSNDKYVVKGGTIECTGSGVVFYSKSISNANIDISGGTVKAAENTIYYDGGENNTLNITGGKVIATEQCAIANVNGAKVSATVSDNAEIYAARKVFIMRAGLTLNVNGGLIDVANTYRPAVAGDEYGVEMKEAETTLNINGGKFILGGSFEHGQMIYHASANTTAKSNIYGGLFVNLNTANTTLFGTNVNFVSGRAIYGDNVTAIVNGSQSASKNLQVYYGEGDDLYYFFTKLAATDAEKAGEMEKGASVRLVSGSTGIRFTTTFKAVEGATYGTIILPARYLANVTSLTYEGLTVNGVDVPAVNGIENNDGTVTVRCALTEIAPENYGVAFAAVAYMYVDGQYYFTQFNMFDNARSIETVAKAALADLTAEQDETHTYKVETAEGAEAYSPYSEAQRATLESFIIASFNLERPTGSTLMNTGSGTYSLYTAGVDANGYAAYKAYIEGLGFLKPSAMAL